MLIFVLFLMFSSKVEEQKKNYLINKVGNKFITIVDILDTTSFICALVNNSKTFNENQ